MKTVFVCFFKTGSCDEIEKHPLAVFSTKELAEKFCDIHHPLVEKADGTEVEILGTEYFCDHYSQVYFVELPFVS